MRVIDFTQGSDQWIAWRKQGVSATDSPVILGKSPYLTPYGLWEQKTGLVQPPDLSKNPNVQRGNRLEPVIRKWMETHFGDVLLPLCAEWDGDPLFRASFDGVTSTGIPVELKAPSEKVFEEVVLYKENSPAYGLYYYQVQHQLLVSEAEYGWLVFFVEGETPLAFNVQRDQPVIDEMIKKGREFWAQVQGNGEPALDPERDAYKPETADQEKLWLKAAAEFRTADIEAKELGAKLKELKSSMKAAETIMTSMMGKFQNGEYAGIKISCYEKTGTIDYKKYLSEKFQVDGDELEAYRRKSSSCVRVTADHDYFDLPAVPSTGSDPDRIDVAVNSWF